MRKPDEFAGFPSKLHPGFGPYPAISRPVLRWDDGDTLWFFIDKGFNDYVFAGVRLWGINAPGTRYPEAATEDERLAGLAAKAYLLETLLPNNTPVTLVTTQDPEKYGRYLGAAIRLNADGELTCVNVEMVESGHAEPREDMGWSDMREAVRASGLPVVNV